MRILVAGWTAAESFETACVREFERAGHEVLHWDNKPRRWWAGRRRWWDLSRPEKFLSDLISSWELYRRARQWRPDIIFMCKGENIRAEVFTVLKREIGCRLAIWYVDNPFHANVSSYQALRHIQKADVYFIWAKYLIDPLISAGARRVEFLPFAFDPESFPDVEIPESEEEQWSSDICFVGTWDPEREAALLPLAGQNFDLAIYGQGWDRYLKAGSPLKAHVRRGSIWQGDVVKAFKGAKLVLNFLRQHNWQGHNFRTMEAAGIGGGVLLTQYTTDQADVLFRDEEEIFSYPGSTPAPEQITELLAQPERLRQVAVAGQKRVEEEHLLCARVQKILHSLKGEL